MRNLIEDTTQLIIISKELKNCTRQELYTKLFDEIKNLFDTDKIYESLDEQQKDATNRILNNITIKSINKVFYKLLKDEVPIIEVTFIYDNNQDFNVEPYGIFVSKVEVK